MGKADKKEAGAAINSEQQRSLGQSNSGINDTQGRVNTLTGRSDSERGNVWGGYSDLAATGGISDQDRYNLRNAGSLAGSGGSGGGGGGGGSSAAGPSYLDTFKSLLTNQGAFDPGRYSAVTGAANNLYDTSGNYGQVDTSIGALQNTRGNYGATDRSVSGLQNFAATGGLNADQLGNINRDTLKEFEKTGGYSDADIGNIRARSNAGIASTYGNMKDTLDRAKIGAGQQGPGWSSAGFKLLRQGAQDQGTNARNTEVDIANAVREGRFGASSKLADLGMSTAGLQSQNTLQGYGTSGALDIDRNRAIDSAMEAAGRLGLGKQAQIDAAKEAAAGIDLQGQGLINQTKLSAAGGLSQDELGRMSIGASSAAANAALNAANERFLISERDANRQTGLGGMLDTYKASPSELLANQEQLFNYRGQAGQQQGNLISDRIQKGYMPGLGSDIMSGLNIAGKAASIAAPIFGGFGGYGSGGASSIAGKGSYTPWQGSYSGNPYLMYPGSQSSQLVLPPGTRT